MPHPFKPLSRRALIRSGAASAALAGLAPSVAFAQRKAQADADLAELMKPTDLPDQSIGSADAKVTIVEYASMTCPHCATFHKRVLPALKAKYVDTGKVRFIFREFPLDDLAAAASMLARCAGGGDTAKSHELTSILFDKQDDWAFERNEQVAKLFSFAKQAGFTEDSFNKCLTDDKLLKQISDVRERATAKFGVNSTPTFFINGKRLNDGPSVENFEKIIEPLLKSS